MVYDIDQCVQCGGVKVEGSDLCVECLVANSGKLALEVMRLEDVIKRDLENAAVLLDRKNDKIKELKYRYKVLWKVTQSVFEEYQKLLMLYKRDGLKLEAVNRAFRYK